MKKLNLYYYGMLLLAVIAATLSYYLIINGKINAVNPLTKIGQAIQYIVIIDALITIPLGLWLHNRRCKELSKTEENNIQKELYYKSATQRIILVSNSMIWAIAAYYIMGAYMSMLWIAAISAIGWYFSKPTEKKMYYELHPQDE